MRAIRVFILLLLIGVGLDRCNVVLEGLHFEMVVQICRLLQIRAT